MGIEPSPHSSIRRKMKGSNGVGMSAADGHGPSNNHRQSLAFELAAAMEPEENDQASILEQLGLGDDDDDDDDDDDNEHDNVGLQEDDEDETNNQASDHEDTIYEADEYAHPNRFNLIEDESGLQFFEPERLRPQRSRSTIGSTNKRYSCASTYGSSCSPRKSSIREASLSTPMRTLGREISRSTLNTIDSSSRPNAGILGRDDSGPVVLQRDPSQIEDENEGGDHEQGGMYGSRRSSQSSEDDDAEILEAGLKSTAKFLNLLKQSNTDCPASVLMHPAPSKQHDVPTSPSSPTTPTAAKPIKENESDRQPVVEKMITDIVRTMTEQVRDRESQIRELKEIEIALSRTDRRFLAELEELPNLLQERDFRNSTILGKSLVPSSDHSSSLGSSKPINDMEDQLDDQRDPQQVEADEMEEEEEEEDGLEGGRLTPTASRNGKQSSVQTDLGTEESKGDGKEAAKKEGKRPIENLGELKLITNSLIHSLNQIHEHTQISRQTQIEIVRKLKGVKGLVANWKTDFDSIQNSIDFISNWELDQFRSPTDSSLNPLKDHRREKIRGVFEVQVKLATSEVEKLLNDAFINASTLLQPHLAPPS